MWQEARKQEKLIRGMMVDYRKRSERRQQYYQKIKADPAQFLRVHGSRYPVHIEEEAQEIELAVSDLFPWQGDKHNLIDRFDVRANLDVIPEYTGLSSGKVEENAVVEQKCAYERWRTLATNDLVGLTEHECLQQITQDEQEQQTISHSSKTPSRGKGGGGGGATIGFRYNNDESAGGNGLEDGDGDGDDMDMDDDIEPDLDMTFDVRELSETDKERLNYIAADSYLVPDFTRLHIEDKIELELKEMERREENERSVRTAKLSKTERKREKVERRKLKEMPVMMSRKEDPHRKPRQQDEEDGRRRKRRSGSHHRHR
eukprot:sb/3466963/